MNGEGSKVAAEPMIIRAIEAGTFSSDYSTLILQGGIKYEHGEGCLQRQLESATRLVCHRAVFWDVIVFVQLFSFGFMFI